MKETIKVIFTVKFMQHNILLIELIFGIMKIIFGSVSYQDQDIDRHKFDSFKILASV